MACCRPTGAIKVLRFALRDSAFKLGWATAAAGPAGCRFAQATAAAPGLRVLKAGVPACRVRRGPGQPRGEHHRLGPLSAVLLLVWLAFRPFRPLLLVALSLLVGCAVALTATVLVFGKIHLLTLIFGASLVGVAEDYGIHWFASRRGMAAARRWSLLRHLLPGLWLALLTVLPRYSALGLAPFPRTAPDGAVLGGRAVGGLPDGDLPVPLARWWSGAHDGLLALAGRHAGALAVLATRRGARTRSSRCCWPANDVNTP